MYCFLSRITCHPYYSSHTGSRGGLNMALDSLTEPVFACLLYTIHSGHFNTCSVETCCFYSGQKCNRMKGDSGGVEALRSVSSFRAEPTGAVYYRRGQLSQAGHGRAGKKGLSGRRRQPVQTQRTMQG